MAWSQPIQPTNEPFKPRGTNDGTGSEPNSGTSDVVPSIKEPAKPEIQSVSAKQIRVAYNKPWLSTEADVDGYVEEYKKVLLATIKAGKHIQL